ncbi:hypothetical protein B0H12DRAFT_144203 [Mycena haematopus]|nr:hypothetical protein B0H12DRAFT_144203 [Mycena haematopus]
MRKLCILASTTELLVDASGCRRTTTGGRAVPTLTKLAVCCEFDFTGIDARTQSVLEKRLSRQEESIELRLPFCHSTYCCGPPLVNLDFLSAADSVPRIQFQSTVSQRGVSKRLTVLYRSKFSPA